MKQRGSKNGKLQFIVDHFIKFGEKKTLDKYLIEPWNLRILLRRRFIKYEPSGYFGLYKPIIKKQKIKEVLYPLKLTTYRMIALLIHSDLSTNEIANKYNIAGSSVRDVLSKCYSSGIIKYERHRKNIGKRGKNKS